MTDNELNDAMHATDLDDLDRHFAHLNRLLTPPVTKTPGSLFGIPVVASPMMTKAVTTEYPLSWRERLLSWPWRPWRRIGRIQHSEPSEEVLLVDLDRLSLVMHPEMVVKLGKESDEISRHDAGHVVRSDTQRNNGPERR